MTASLTPPRMPLWTKAAYGFADTGINVFVIFKGLLILAFSLSEASFLAPLLYTEIIMQAVLGYAVWGDVPGTLALVGMLLIIAVGIFLGLSESSSPQESERSRRGSEAPAAASPDDASTRSDSLSAAKGVTTAEPQVEL